MTFFRTKSCTRSLSYKLKHGSITSGGFSSPVLSKRYDCLDYSESPSTISQTVKVVSARKYGDMPNETCRSVVPIVRS